MTDDRDIANELRDLDLVRRCARQHETVGDLSAMKICYLLRHHPDLAVTEVADLVGLSVSATSRCLTKLKKAGIADSVKTAQIVRYKLNDTAFTQSLIAQWKG